LLLGSERKGWMKRYSHCPQGKKEEGRIEPPLFRLGKKRMEQCKHQNSEDGKGGSLAFHVDQYFKEKKKRETPAPGTANERTERAGIIMIIVRVDFAGGKR